MKRALKPESKMNDQTSGFSVHGNVLPTKFSQAESKLKWLRAEIAAREVALPKIREEGEAALRRLLPVASNDTGQSHVIARFLLSIYNGNRFPFSLMDFRRLDYQLFADCMLVLKMDSQPAKEVHTYSENGKSIFEQLARHWNVKDFGGENWRHTKV